MAREILIQFRTGALDAAKRTAESLKRITKETLEAVRDPKRRAELRAGFREESKIAAERVASAERREQAVRANALADAGGVSGALGKVGRARAIANDLGDALGAGSLSAANQLVGGIAPGLAAALAPVFGAFLATSYVTKLIREQAEEAAKIRVEALVQEALASAVAREVDAKFAERLKDPVFARQLSRQAFEATLLEERRHPTGTLRDGALEGDQ